MKKLILPAVLALSLITGSAAADVRVYVNGVRIDEETILTDGRTYIPLRAVSEALGAEVGWDDASKSAFITFSEDDAVSKIVENVSPSVVAVIGNYISGSESSKFNNPTAHGTGVIYKSDGHILTNAHVVAGIMNLTVVLANGESLPARVLYSDEVADLAVIKVDKVGLTPVVMADGSKVFSGQTAIAIGTPISLSMRNTVTKGIVSGTGVALGDSYYKLLQTDTTINPGNSGGPLLNIRGELIGITSSKYVGVGIENMSFAIPVDTVRYAVSQFEKNGKIVRADLKMTLEQSWEAKIGLPTEKGLTVKSSRQENIAPGSVITEVNKIRVHSTADLNEALKNTYSGGSIEVKFTLDGQEQTVYIN